MPTATTPPLPTERQLRRLLASSKPEDAAALEALLGNARPHRLEERGALLEDGLAEPAPVIDVPGASEHVRSLLVYIAKDARNVGSLVTAGLVRAGRSYLLLLGICWSLFAYLAEYFVPDDAIATLLFFGAMLVGCALLAGGEAYLNARATNRAPVNSAFLLARLGDVRVVGILARLWTPRPLTHAEADFNANVGHELARLLAERQGERYELGAEDALRRLVERTFPNGLIARIRQRLAPRPDLTEAESDLLLEVVRHLSNEHPQKMTLPKPQADEVTLRRVAAETARGPNYDLLRDAAQVLLRAGQGTS